MHRARRQKHCAARFHANLAQRILLPGKGKAGCLRLFCRCRCTPGRCRSIRGSSFFAQRATSTRFRLQHLLARAPTHRHSPPFRFSRLRIPAARPMLGPACLRRLQTPRPYVCLQCLRSPRTPPRALGALRAARYHSSPLLRNDAESAPSKQSDPSLPSETAKPKTKGTKKKRKKRAQSPATRKTVHGELKVRRLTTGDRAAASESQNSEDGNGSDAPQPENGSLPILPKKKLNKLKRRQEKAANKSARKAMQGKRPAPEDAKGGGDIGDVLQKASEGAAEVLAAAAKSPTKPKRSKAGSASDKAETLEQALQRLKKQKAKRRPKREFVNSVSARDAQLTRKLPLCPSPYTANMSSDRCGAAAYPPTLLWIRPCSVQVCVCDAV